MICEQTKYLARTCLAGFVLVCVLCTSVLGFAGQPSENSQDLNATPLLKSEQTVSIVELLCSEIHNGNFAAARQILDSHDESPSSSIKQLADIISQYEAIEHHRQLAREAAYNEKIGELEEFQIKFDDNDTNDVNDVNDITSALSVIAQIVKFANDPQKSKLLDKPLVKKVFEKAMAKAIEYEAEGKWLEAYIICYSWMQVIDENNKTYPDHSDQLIEKANIVASFQDTPCETSKQRYENVKKSMFAKALELLHFSYVSYIDYRQMATKALKRCKLLADVLQKSFDEISQNNNFSKESESGEELKRFFSQPDKKKLSAWLAGLAVIQKQVDKSVIGLSKDEFKGIFEKVLELNATTIELPEAILITKFTEAALSTLDPHTAIIWPKQVEDFKKLLNNEFTGIGIEISKPKGLLTAVSLLIDTPAFYSGLDAGDIIEEVDGVPTKDMSITCAVKNITGPKGTKVKLRIRRPNEDKDVEDKLFELTITRARITVPTIRGWQRTENGKWLYMVDPARKIGYVRITSFTEKTADDFESVLDQLESDGLGGLILDLRYNSGGLLESAIAIADKFIEKGLIVRTQPRIGVPRWEGAHKKGTHPDYPLVILINDISASASEIVAGALADEKYNRAIFLGERTHGKGSVQTITYYPGGGAQLKYTMAYYHLPSNQRVESQEAMKKQGRSDWGVGPDIEVKMRRDEEKKMFEIRRDNDVLAKADHNLADRPLKKHTIEETLAIDSQLAIALLVVQSKLIQAETLALNLN